MNISIDINGKDVTASIEPRVTLLDFIRDVAGLKVPMPDANMGYVGPVQYYLRVRPYDHV